MKYAHAVTISAINLNLDLLVSLQAIQNHIIESIKNINPNTIFILFLHKVRIGAP